MRKAWKYTLDRVQETGGETSCLIQPVASIREVEKIENELKVTFPLKFKEVLFTLSRHVEVEWQFADDVIVIEDFKNISMGQLTWNLEKLSIHRDGTGKATHLVFTNTPTGDYFAFPIHGDKANEEVLYWYEDESILYEVAPDFLYFVQHLTDLHLIGSDIQDMSYFIQNNRINSLNQKSKKWKKWFETFKPVDHTKFYSDFNEIFSYIVHLNRLGEQEVKILSLYDKELLLDQILIKLKHTNNIIETRLLCFIIGQVIKDEAKNWVFSLWQDSRNIPPDMRAYLSAKCIPVEQGLHLVFDDIEREEYSTFEIVEQLKYFRSNEVIQWMKTNVKLPYSGWDYLFAYSNPTWTDFLTWFNFEFRHLVVSVNALGALLSLNRPLRIQYNKNNEEPFKIKDLPHEEEVIRVLQEIKKGEYKMRNGVIDKFITNIKIFY